MAPLMLFRTASFAKTHLEPAPGIESGRKGQ